MTPEITPTLPRTSEQLRWLRKNPSALIPNRLLELVAVPSRVQAVPFRLWLGRMDQEFLPPLAVLFVERNGLETPKMLQENDDEIWGKVLNQHRLAAIEQALVSDSDKVLISLIANDIFSSGVMVIDYIETEELRRKGLGWAFYDNFEKVLQNLGCRYIFGANDRTNLPFFLKRDRYLITELKSAEPMTPPLWLPKIYPPTIPTIKFLDRNLETECVQPQYLK